MARKITMKGQTQLRKLKDKRQPVKLRLNPVTAFIRTSLPAGLLFGLHAGTVMAGPEGGVVAAGEGNIAKPNASTTVVNQASQNLVVNWESFNVKKAETVNFKQPNKSAQALNRIFDQNPSQIHGSINANGKVLLINPNGVIFSPTAKVNVGGLVASGLDIKDDDFMAGKHTFFNQDGSEGGMVVNQGLIQAATGGSVTLMGGAVRNEGTILATAGQVNLVAGKKVTMDFDGDGLIQFTVDEEILQNAHDLDDAISNTGTINADGGSVLLKGKAAKDVFTNVVNNSGVIGANKIQNVGGEIKLVASGTSNSLINTGALNASSSDSDGGTIEIYASDTAIISEDALITAASSADKGGTVTVEGDKVGLLGNATIDASGETGGGEVLIGGDYQGSNPDINNASYTTITADASINADAITEGDGGKVIVWSDKTTRFEGDITAEGGSESGDGGFVEVSGKEHLAYKGTVSTNAENGETGTLLLDPTDITIQTAGPTDIESTTAAGTETFQETTPSNSSILTVADLLTALGSNNVTITAASGAAGNGDITVANDINTVADLGAARTLTLDGKNITFNAGLDATQGGNAQAVNLVLTADTVNGGGNVDINAAITTNNGNFNSTSAGTFDNTGGAINVGTGSITVDASSVTAGASLNAPTNTVDLTGDTGVTFQSTVNAATLNATTTNSTISSTAAANITATTATLNAGNSTVNIIAGSTVDIATINATGTGITVFDDANGIELGDIDGANTASITSAGGDITDTVAGGAGDNIDAATLNLIATGYDIIIDAATNNLDELSATGVNITVVNSDQLTLGAVTAIGDLSATSVSEGINDSAVQTISVTGDTNLVAAAGYDIILDTAGHDFQGAGGVSASGQSVTLIDTNAIVLNDIDATGNLVVLANGAGTITQTAAGGANDNINVTGTTSLTATGDVITLTASTNDFGGTVTSSGSDVSLTDTNALDIGVTVATGTLAINAGALSASGNVNATTALNLTADSLTVNDGTFNAGSVGGSWDIGTGGLTLNGGLGPTLNATSGTITNEGDLTIAAASNTFNANGGTITFDGAGTQTVTLNGESLNTVTTTGKASGALNFTDSTAIATNFTTAATNHNISFTGATNSVGGTATFNNTGTITFGDASTDSITFANGVDTTAATSTSISGTLAATNNNITLETTSIDANDSVINAGTGTVTIAAGGGITAAANNFDVIGGVVNFNSGANSITGTGVLDLQPATATDSIGIAGGAGTFSISTTDLAAFSEGFSSIHIGTATTGSHAITINAVSFKDSISILTPAGGSITVNGQLDTLASTDLATITLDGSGATTTLSADVITAGAAVTISDSVLVDGSILIDTTSGGAAAGSVTITGAIDGANAGAGDDLTIDAAQGAVDGTGDAAVDLQGDVEGAAGAISVTGGQDLEGLTIEGGQIDVADIVITDADIDIEGTNIDLNDSTYTTITSGRFTFDSTSTIDLAGAVTVTTAGGDRARFIAASGVVGSGADPLTVNTSAGNGEIDFQTGANVSSVSGFTANAGAGDVTLQNVTGVLGPISVTGGDGAVGGTVIDLQGTTYSAAGNITFTGDVNLGQTGGTTAISTLVGAFDISFTQEIDDAGSDTALTLNASAGGNVSISGNVGADSIIESLTVTNSNITGLADVNTNGVINVTATTETNLNGTSYLSNDGDITFTGAVDLEGAGDVTLNSDADTDATDGAITFNNAVTDTGSDSGLILTSGANISTDAITINNTLDINIDADADGTNSLTSTGAYSAGTITISGTVNDTIGFGDDAGDSITATASSVSINNLGSASFAGDILGATGVTLSTIGSGAITLGAGVDITATAGNVDLNNSVASIDFNGAGSTNIITAGGAVELATITDSAATTELEINAGTNITLDSVTLDAGTATLDINLDTGADDAAILNVTGLLNAGTITANGQGTNDSMNFGDGAGDTVTSTNADITIDTANTVSFTDDIVGATGVTIQNINTDINLGADVDVTATTGNVDLNNAVTAIDLIGVGSNIISATAGAVELAAIGDTANIAELEINADTDITLDSIVLDNGGASLLDINLDTGAGGSETLNVTGALTAGSIDIQGTGARNDTMTFGGLLTSSTGSVFIITADTVNLNGGITSATTITVDTTDTTNAAGGTTIQTTSGAIDLRSGVTTGFNITGAGLLTIDGNGGGAVQIADITDSANADLTVNSDGGVIISSVDMDGGGTLTVNGGITGGSIVNFVGTVNAGAITLTGTGGDDSLQLNGATSSTVGAININTFNQIDADNIIAQTDLTVAGTNIDLNNTTYTGTTGLVTFTGAVDLDLAGGTTTVTSGGGGGDDITFTSTVDDSAVGDTALTLNAGASGNVLLQGNVGTGTQIGAFSATGATIDIDGNLNAAGITATASTLIDVAAGTLDTNGSNLDFSGADITIGAATLQSTGGGGSAIFRGDDVTDTIGIGDGATAADVDLSEAELQTVVSTFNDIVIGSGTQSGTITVNDAGGLTGLNNSIHLNATAGDISVSSNIDLSATAGAAITITGDGTTTTLSADMITAGGAININDTVLVDGAVLLDTTATNSANAATVTITGAIDGANAGGTDTLTIDAAQGAVDGTNDAAVDLQSAIGTGVVAGAQDLEGLTIDGAQIDVANITIDSGNIDIEGTNIDLNGTTYQTTTSGTIGFTGSVDLHANVTATSAGGAADSISFSSTIDADDATTNDRSLSLVGGAGDVTVTGAIGGTQALDGGVTISGATINTDAITTSGTDAGADKAAGAVTIDATGGTVTIGGSINAAGKGTGAGGLVDIDADGANAVSVNTIFAFSGSGNGGNILLNDGGGTGVVTLNGGLNNDGVVGGNIVLGTATELGATPITISTGSAGGDITFDSTLNSSAGTNRALTLTAGTGDVTLSGATGGTAGAELLSFSITTANNVSLQDVTTDTGAITLGTNAATRLDGILTLNGDLTSHDGANGAGAISLFADDIRLVGAGPGTISLNSNGSTDAVITIDTTTGTLESTTAWLDGLTLDSGTSTIDLSGATITNLDHLDVTTASMTLGDTTIGDGAGNGGVALDINTTGNLTLNGDITSNDATSTNAGAIDLAGVGGTILLNNGGATDATTVSISTNAAGTDADISLGNIDDNGGDINLAVDAGIADVTLNTVGTGDAIGTLTVDGNDIAFNGNVESTTITATTVQNGGDNDSISIAGGVTLDANGSNMVFRTDDIAFPGSATLTSTGGGTSVTFAGETDATSIGLGTGSAGTLQITQDELNIVDSTFTEIIVGVDTTQSGTIQVDDSGGDNNLTIDNTGLRLRVETGPGDIDINSTITLSNSGSDFNIEGAGDTTLLSGDITTNGGDIVINDTVLVDGVRTLDSGNSATAATAGLIQITGDIGSVDTSGDSLTLDARGNTNDGAVDVQGDVGAGTVNGAAANDLTGFTVFGAQVDIANVEVTSGNIAITGSNIDLNSTTYQTTTSGSITFTGAVDLDQAGGTTTVQTAGGFGDNITFSSTINDDVNGDTALTLNAGANGNVSTGNIGGSLRPGTVDIDGATIDVGDITVEAANILITGTTIDLNGSGYNANTSGLMTFTGPVNLNASGGVSFTTAGGAGDDISFTSTVDDDIAGDSGVTINAGAAGDVTITGALGGTTRVGNTDIDGLVINVDSIHVDGVGGSANMFVGTLGTTTTINLNGTTYESLNSPTSGIIRFDGPVTLNQAGGTTTVTSTSGADSDITFRGTVDDDAGGDTALVVNTGAAGDTVFQGIVGGATAIESLTVTNAARIRVLEVTTTGLQSYTSADIDIEGNAYTSTTAGAITFTGPVDLRDGAGTITIQTNGGAATDDIIFTDTIDDFNSDNQLDLIAGAGDVDLQGNAGATNPLDAFTVTSANQVDLQNVFTDNNISVTATNIDLNGTTYTSTAGSATFDGAVDLHNDVAISAIGINFNDDLNSSTGTNRDLTLTAGAGNINFGDAGGDTVGNTDALDAVLINTAANLTTQDTFAATSFTQTAGTGTTQINGQMDLTGTGTNTSITTTTIDINDNINTNGGNVVLSAASGITLDGGNITTTGILNAADTTDNAGTVDIDVTGSGNVAFTGTIIAIGAASTASAAGDGGLVTINTFDGDIAVDNITTSGGNGTGQNGGNAAAIQITAGDADNSFNEDITTSTLTSLGGTGTVAGTDSNVTLTALGGAIVDGNIGGLNVVSNTLTIDARNGVADGDLFETTVASIDVDNSTSGNIEIRETDGLIVTNATQATDADANDIRIISATGDIEIDSISTGGTDGDVTLNAIAGAVTDRLADTNLDITADVLTIDADTGVGSANALETIAETFDVDINTSGNIDIDNNYSAGTVTLTNLNVVAGTGTINFDNTGNQALTITSVTTNDGDITITNTGDDATDTVTIGGAIAASGANTVSISSITRGDVAVNNTITTANGGTITINSSDDITLGAFALNSGAAGGTINLNVDTNNDVAAILDLGGGTLTANDINLDGGANTAHTDTLIAQNLVNTFTLNAGDDDGTLANVSLSSTADFTDFHNLTGNANNDTFAFTGGSITGNITAAGGTNTLDYSGLAGPISVTLDASGANGFDIAAGGASQVTGTITGITDLTGSTGTDTLTGINAAAAWDIDGTNTYTSTNILNFSAIENLTGNADVDTFNVTANHTGNMDGQGGDDAFNLSLTAVVTGNLLGDAGDDTFDFDNTARVTGNVDGGASATPDDSIDFSGSTIANLQTSITGTGTLHGQQGTILDSPLSTPLISGTFDNIDSLVGNGSQLLGNNVDTFWNITGANSGTFGTTLATIGANTFNNFSIVGGTANDTFVFQNGAGQVTGGIDGGTGTNTLTGSLGVDAFVIDAGGTSVTITPAGSGLATSLTNITNIDGANATDDGTTTVGDTGNDTFAINNDWNGSIDGSGGDDTFTFADTRTVGGTLTGGAGTDIIDWNAFTTARDITLTASAANGFSGTEVSITGGFVTIDDVRGSTTGGQVDTLTGLDGVTSTWTVNGGGTQYSNDTGSHTLAFSDFEDLNGGTGVDNFNITGAHSGDLAGGGGADVFDVDFILTGSINGEGGTDTLQGNLIDAVTLTGSDANGFDGTEADITANFDGIDTITGNGGTLTGENTNSTWDIDATPTYNDGSNTLNFSGFANLQGGTNEDEFEVSTASTFNLFGGAGNDEFEISATLTGAIDGETGSDTLQGNSIDAVVLTGSDADGFAGTEADITGNFDGIGEIVGNGGTLTGQNLANTWTLDGDPDYNNGTHSLDFSGFANLQGGTSTDAFNITAANAFNLLGGAGVDTFDVGATLTGLIDGETGVDILQGTTINAVVLAASDADGFAGTEANITGDFDGIGTITGNGGTLTGRNTASTWALDGTPTYNDGANTLNYTGFANLQGGTNADAFNITAASAFNLGGGNGVDTFDVGATLTGSIDGDAGADILQGTQITDVVLTGSNGNGYSGTEADITGNFDGISILTGTNAALTGENVASSFDITGANSGTYNGGTGALTFTGVQDVTGGSSTDIVTFTNAGSLTGNVSGGAGNNTLVGDADGNAFTVTAANSGTLTGKTAGWSNFRNLSGGAGVDTFTVNSTLSGLIDGNGGADTATFNPSTTVTLNGTNTGISEIENLDMTGDGVLAGGTTDNVWTLNTAGTGGTVNDGTTLITFTATPTIRSGTGADTFRNPAGGGTYSGTIEINESVDNRWDFTSGQTLTTGALTGTGALQVRADGSSSAAPVDVTIGAGDLVLPDVSAFNGHLVIGGTILDNGAIGGTTPQSFFDPSIDAAGDVDVTTAILTVDTTGINAGGTLTLLGGDVILNGDITAGNTIGLIATGQGGATGNIDASAGDVTLTAPNTSDPAGAFIAQNEILESTNITLAFAGGEVDVATGGGEDVEFAGASISTDVITNPDFEAFTTSAAATAIGLTVGITTTFSINPASALIGLETLAFIDLGLFEEELTLYGTIGSGIALTLAQCEEQEGCAPNVTEDELNTIIGTLEARIFELERRLAESDDADLRSDLETLIAGFNEELQKFQSYRADLDAFFAAEAALEEEFEDEFVEEDGFLDEETTEPDADEVSVLAGVLETIKGRIEWLESLKGNPEERARLSEATGIDLTIETLDTLIEAAQAEAAFIENRIRLLLEGTEAMLGAPVMFTAEARDYDSTQVLHFGPDLLKPGTGLSNTTLNIF